MQNCLRSRPFFETGLALLIQAAISVIVCNLALIATAIYRFIGLNKAEDELFLTGQYIPRNSSDEVTSQHTNSSIHRDRWNTNARPVRAGLGSGIQFWRHDRSQDEGVQTIDGTRSGWGGGVRPGRVVNDWGSRHGTALAVTVDMEVDTDRRDTVVLGPVRSSRAEAECDDGDSHGYSGKGSRHSDAKEGRIEDESDAGWSPDTAFAGSGLEKDGGAPRSPVAETGVAV